MENSPLDMAIRAAEVKTGLKGSAALAEALGNTLTRQAIDQWKAIPVARLRDIERATGIPRAELRPDIFGDVA